MKRSKKAIKPRHANNRIQERYDERLTPELRNHILSAIFKGKATIIQTPNIWNQHRYIYNVFKRISGKKKWYKVVVNKKCDVIITFLPYKEKK